MAHAQIIALHCVDPRFQRFFWDFLHSSYPGMFDPISLPGGACKPLLIDCQEYLFEQINFLIEHHHPGSVLLFQHEDCAAYGGSKKFGENEKDFHRRELEAAETLLKKHIPLHVSIQKFFVNLSGEIEKIR